jgi:hypothetical protein
MYKPFIFLVLVTVTVVSNARSFNIRHLPSNDVRGNVGIILCPECVNEAVEAIDTLLNLIINEGIVKACSDLCGALVNKTGSHTFGIACDLACDAVGIEEFVQLITHFDIDPIWYCQLAKLCPSAMTNIFFLDHLIESISL